MVISHASLFRLSAAAGGAFAVPLLSGTASATARKLSAADLAADRVIAGVRRPCLRAGGHVRERADSPAQQR